MELTKRDSKVLKGVAILSLLMLHLFCRKENLPYQPLFYIGKTPLIYYFGLFGDICVPIFCFVSGYAHWLAAEGSLHLKRLKTIFQFCTNLWIILGGVTLVGLLTGNQTIPGSLKEFALNALTLKNSYNGAWWYANTYILLVLLQPLSCKFVARLPAALSLACGFVVYAAGYAVRFLGLLQFENALARALVERLALLATSFFPYMVGMLFCRHRIVTRLRQIASGFRAALVRLLAAIGFAFLICFHALCRTNFVAVFNAILVICMVSVAPVPSWWTAALAFLGKHSGNIWIVHMFFYAVLFENFVFCAKYPVLIFLLLLALSTVASMLLSISRNSLKCKAVRSG